MELLVIDVLLWVLLGVLCLGLRDREFRALIWGLLIELQYSLTSVVLNLHQNSINLKELRCEVRCFTAEPLSQWVGTLLLNEVGEHLEVFTAI